MTQPRALRIKSIEAKVEMTMGCDVLMKVLELEEPNLDIQSSDGTIFKFHRNFLMGNQHSAVI